MHHRFFHFVLGLMLALSMAVITVGTPLVRAVGTSWYVSPLGDDNNDCLTPITACATINGALGKAIAGDTINIAVGTYTGTGNEVVLIDKDITLSGGWDESFTTQGTLSTVDGQASRRGITVNGGVTAFVGHFMLQNGNVAGGGGGIQNAGTLTITDSNISNNVAGAGSGSGIYNTSSGVMNVNNSTITHNGSGEICWTIVNEGTFTMNASVVEENTTTTIYCAVLTIMNSSGTMNITNTSVKNNSGGVYNYAALNLNNSLISNNVGSDGPGGIYNWGGNLTVTNSTISGNTTSNGGGIFAGGGGTIRLNNATISNNAANRGGGIYNLPNFPADIMMQNTLLAGNIAVNSGADCSGAIASFGYNLVGNTLDCAFVPTIGDITDTDPFLGPLQDNGGTTFTHALLPQSPAIDAGINSGCADQNGNPLITDQRGMTRPQGVGCDMGAYEYIFTTPGPAVNLAVINGNNQQTALNHAFPKLLRVVALDSQGNRVSGVTITFTAPASGASGTFGDTGSNMTSVDTDAGGVATASTYTANGIPGAYSISASTSGLGSVDFNLEQIDYPANDDFANAEAISILPFSTVVDITNATNVGEPGPCYSFMERTVWYSFTPSQTMGIRVDTLGTALNRNLNVYRSTGPGLAGLSFMNCAVENGSFNFLAEAGQTYYLQVGTVFNEVGTIQINLEQIPAPANDDFVNATVIPSPLPFDDTVDISLAGAQTGEPTPTCASNGLNGTVWYTFTPTVNGSVSAKLNAPFFTYTQLAAYSGNSLGSLTELGCSSPYGAALTFQVSAGTTYYFQAGNYFSGQGDSIQFHLEVTPPPVAGFFYSPSDPSSFDTLQFYDQSYDPAQIGLQAYAWNFGDGTTSTLPYPTHKYEKDGDYTVQYSITTVDGRTASIIQVVNVRTHDVAIAKINAPQSASAKQTRTITVSVKSKNYAETVQIELYKSVAGGFEYVGSITQLVPARSTNRTVAFTFSYTFTSSDASIGKVTFKAVATIVNARDSYPSDNEAISSPPTKVGK